MENGTAGLVEQFKRRREKEVVVLTAYIFIILFPLESKPGTRVHTQTQKVSQMHAEPASLSRSPAVSRDAPGPTWLSSGSPHFLCPVGHTLSLPIEGHPEDNCAFI